MAAVQLLYGFLCFCVYQEGWHGPALSLFAKVSLIFSCKQPKVACFQNFCWHSSISVAVYSNNLIWHKHLVFPFDVQRSRSKFLALLSLHSKPEPRLSRKGWSGSGCCVAIFYCQISHRTLKIERPSAWDTRRWPWEGEPENAAGRGQEIHAGRTAHPTSCVQNEHMRLFSLVCIRVDKLSTWILFVLRLTSTWHFVESHQISVIRSLCGGLRTP